MADQLTLDSLCQVAGTYLRAMGEPPLRDASAAIHEIIALFEQATEVIQRARRIAEMSKIFCDGYVEDNVSPRAWDNLVRDFSEQDMQIVHRVFSEHEWPTQIPYPNLVALVGHIDGSVAGERTIAMLHEAERLATRAVRLQEVANVYFVVLTEPSTSLNKWDELTRDYDEEDLEAVRKLFRRESWPRERHSVPYPNLAALARWNEQKHAVQSALLVVVLEDVFGSLDMLEVLLDGRAT